MRDLDKGFVAEVDKIDESGWASACHGFSDANIYQTWPYGRVIAGTKGSSHLVLKHEGEIVAVAQARLAKLPFLNIGVAYVRWGPLWCRTGSGVDSNIFRQAIRALRNEFACKRGLVLRVFPSAISGDTPDLLEILKDEGFGTVAQEGGNRTILMNLDPPVDELRQGMNSHWKRELKLAERHELEVVESTGVEVFDEFIEIYKEMVSRKGFVEPNNIFQFRRIQEQLPEDQKMITMLAKSGGVVCAGLVCSALGDSAVYIFGATSSAGLKKNGSYLLHWKLLDRLKQRSTAIYNLNGINPARNPGTYKFKNDLAGKNGRDVFYLGRFDTHSNWVSSKALEAAESVRRMYSKAKQQVKSI